MTDGEPAQEHNLAEIPQCQPVAQPAEHHKSDNVARQRGAIEGTVAALVELCTASSASEPTIALRCQVRALGHCSATAANAIHHHQLRRAVQRRSYEGWPPATSHAGMARGVAEPVLGQQRGNIRVKATSDDFLLILHASVISAPLLADPLDDRTPPVVLV